MIKKKLLTIFVSIVMSTTLMAQDNCNERCSRILNKASELMDHEKFDSAFTLIQEAYTIAFENKNHEMQGLSQSMAARLYYIQNNEETALAYYIRSLSSYNKAQKKEPQQQILTLIARIYASKQDHDKAIAYFTKALKKTDIESHNKKSSLYKQIGTNYFAKHNFDSASVYYNKMSQLAKSRKDTLNILISNKLLSDVAIEQGNYQLAIDFNKVNLDIYAAQSNLKGQLVCMNNIGSILVRDKKYKNAIKSHTTAIKLCEQNPGILSDIPLSGYINLGICYKNQFDYENALRNLNKADEKSEKLGDPEKEAQIKKLMALIYLEIEDLYNASTYAENAVIKANQTGNAKLRMECYQLYSEILKKTSAPEKALDYYQKYLHLKDSLQSVGEKSQKQITEAQTLLKETEEKEKLKLKDEELKEALYYQQQLELEQMKIEKAKDEKEKELLLKEKELSEANKQRLAQQLVLKEKENERIRVEKKNKELQDEKEKQQLLLEKQEAEKAEREKEISLLEEKRRADQLTLEKQNEQRKKAQYVMFLGGIILLMVVYFLMSTKRKNKMLTEQKNEISEKNEELKQQSEELATQRDFLEQANADITQKNEEIMSQQEKLEVANKEITFKNQQITDSIKYAKHIQNAVLPPMENFEGNFSDYFLLYKPKDIVSGDFYWVNQFEDKVIIAISDCTGHGVPGAFMSMLGISFLNELVTVDNFINPADTLDKLREKVKGSLRQTGKENVQKSGMDMVLISVNLKEMKLEFAGANNPLLMIRNNEENLLKPDKMPIGNYRKEKPFTNHVVEIQPGDLFYAYSDGYQDQFGGPKGRKFLSKRFRDLLIANCNSPMPEQQMMLDKTLNRWQGHSSPSGEIFDQIDDIVVMGIRI